VIAQEGWTQEDWYEWAENSGIPGVLATPLGVLVRDNSGFNASIYMHGGDTSSPAGFYGYLSISLGWIAAPERRHLEKRLGLKLLISAFKGKSRRVDGILKFSGVTDFGKVVEILKALAPFISSPNDYPEPEPPF